MNHTEGDYRKKEDKHKSHKGGYRPPIGGRPISKIKKMSQITEGDYRLEKHHDAYRVYSNQDQCIAIFPILKNGKWDVELARESEANAKLFLAASEMKKAHIEINGLCADAANTENGKLNVDEVAKISMRVIKLTKGNL